MAKRLSKGAREIRDLAREVLPSHHDVVNETWRATGEDTDPCLDCFGGRKCNGPRRWPRTTNPCPHGRPEWRCVRCDPWCRRDATEAEINRWQKILDTNDVRGPYAACSVYGPRPTPPKVKR